MKRFKILCFTLVCMGFVNNQAWAQFGVDGQIVQRAEYRNGYGRFLAQEEEPAQFIAQRARLNAQYSTEKFKFHVSVQDIRTWGNTPQIKLTDGFLSVHEAWAETELVKNLSVKLGRQELNYDNFRFLGNLDWALQARAHDFALLKYENGATKFHSGGGYNQEAQTLTATPYRISNQYKAAQFLRLEHTINNFKFSAFLWNNGLEYHEVDSNNDIMNNHLRYTQTLGFPTLEYQSGNFILSGFLYYQLGKDRIGREVDAYNISTQLSHLWIFDAEKGHKFRTTGGVEILSGTATNESAKNTSFSPLYGTNHTFNGYMDFFYVGGNQENSVGLKDVFLRMRYDINPNLFFSLNGHSFSSEASIYINGQEIKKHLGYETDLSLGYLLNNSVSLQAGYSQFFASENFEKLQNVQNPAVTQNWAYIMMIYRPTMSNRIIGLRF